MEKAFRERDAFSYCIMLCTYRRIAVQNCLRIVGQTFRLYKILRIVLTKQRLGRMHKNKKSHLIVIEKQKGGHSELSTLKKPQNKDKRLIH